MANSAQQIMQRGKRSVANYVKSECLMKSVGHPQLLELLNYLLDCSKNLDDYDRLDWCRWLISGGETFDEFAKTVRKYDNATTCGLVWTADFVAYRCRTCGISPCMSLCADCFQAGNHSGHDFNMFRSQAGGACDCGDTSVMKACGFCARHGPERAAQAPPASPPVELLAVAEAMMPRLLFRLLQHMRSHAQPVSLDAYIVAMQDAEPYVSFLHQLSDMGAAMRRIFTRTLTNPQVYANYTQGENVPSSGPLNAFRDQYEAAKQSMPAPRLPPDFTGVPYLAGPLEHSTLLSELLMWVIRFEFPQKLVTLLLSILPDDEYKEAFTAAFIQHYSRVTVALVASADRPRISNRVVHISVQLLSPEKLATQMVQQYGLLYIMLASLKDMMDGILIDSGVAIQSADADESEPPSVVDCGNEVLKDHCYWPIVSDLINVLSHKPIAHRFMEDEKLLRFWFELLSYFQGMNMNQRETSQHVEYEPETYYAAFSAELEICSSTMWSMLVHCRDQDTLPLTTRVIRIVLRALDDWFSEIYCRPFAKPHPLQVTFHLPLHRYLAVFLSQSVKYQDLQLTAVLPPATSMQMLMMHPLQIQVVFAEIFCGMWVRNGLQIRGQAMTYIQCHFCNSMIDADFYLLQLCALSLDADFFVRTVLERFHVVFGLTLASREARAGRGLLDAEHEMPLLEAALSFLATVLTVRTQLAIDDRELTRQEMVALLVMADRTHSQLLDMMPEKCGLTGQAKDFEPTLKEVSDYKAPNFEAGGGMQQGMYVPRGAVWEDAFDPMYVVLRAMYRKDFQAAMDRFTGYVKQQGLFSGSSPPWPPFRLPGPPHPQYAGIFRLLHCANMHGLIFTLLYKAVHDNVVTDAVVYFTVYLLEMAVCVESPAPPRPPTTPTTGPAADRAWTEWFPNNDIFANVCHEMTEVAVQVIPGKQESPRTSCSATNNPNPARYQTANTASSTSSSGNWTSMAVVPDGTSSEVINAVQAMLEETTQQLEAAASTNEAAEDGQPRSTRSTGCSANLDTRPTTAVYKVNECIVSLLFKLHTKLSGGGGGGAGGKATPTYVPPRLRKHASPAATANPGPSGSQQQAEEGEKDSRIGDGAFFVAKVLDKLSARSESCRVRIETIYRESLPPEEGPSKKKKTDLDERRRRARERQARVMADFANRQRQFMQKHMTTDDPEAGVAVDDDPAAAETAPPVIVPETEYDCVICNQATASTQERPVGVVALLQASSVLGHRRHTAEVTELPMTEDIRLPTQRTENCSAEFEKRLASLMAHFDESSCLVSVNSGWAGGVHAQTCGHHVHLDCHEAYIESLKSQRQHQQTLKVSAGEFQCPLCRQLSNSALPLMPDVGPAVTTPLPRADRDIVMYIADVMKKRPITPGSTTLTKAMGSVMENLTNATYPQYKTFSKTPSAESVLIFVCSVLRANVELDLLQHGGSPCLPAISPLVAKKSCLLPLLHVLSMHSKILTITPYADLWCSVAGVGGAAETRGAGGRQTENMRSSHSDTDVSPSSPGPSSQLQIDYRPDHAVATFSFEEPSTSSYSTPALPYYPAGSRSDCSENSALSLMRRYDRTYADFSGINPSNSIDAAPHMKEVPLLLKDMSALLIQFVLTMPPTMDQAIYRQLVRGLFCAAYVQALAVVTCKFSAEERSAWGARGGGRGGCCSLEGLMALVIQQLGEAGGRLYEDDSATDPHVPAICQSVWSPQSVELLVCEQVLSFLRVAASLQSILYSNQPPTLPQPGDQEREYAVLCEFLGLVAEPMDSTPAPPPPSSATALRWFTVAPAQLVKGWCQGLTAFVAKHALTARSLLLTNPVWHPPRFIGLPRQYDGIFQLYRKKICNCCNSIPKDPALCLLCGQLICFKEECCQQDGVHEAIRHCVACAAGTGLFLIVQSSVTVVIRGPRASIWGSMYLDEHGEEDRDLKRGKPLYLSDERYNVLHQQWITHSFDRVCKRWVFHYNKL